MTTAEGRVIRFNQVFTIGKQFNAFYQAMIGTSTTGNPWWKELAFRTGANNNYIINIENTSHQRPNYVPTSDVIASWSAGKLGTLGNLLTYLVDMENETAFNVVIEQYYSVFGDKMLWFKGKPMARGDESNYSVAEQLHSAELEKELEKQQPTQQTHSVQQNHSFHSQTVNSQTFTQQPTPVVVHVQTQPVIYSPPQPQFQQPYQQTQAAGPYSINNNNFDPRSVQQTQTYQPQPYQPPTYNPPVAAASNSIQPATKFSMDAVTSTMNSVRLSDVEVKVPQQGPFCRKCMKVTVDATIAPCGHEVFCMSCVKDMKGKKCPVCDDKIKLDPETTMTDRPFFNNKPTFTRRRGDGRH